jgi:hypothetical protein
MAAPILTVDGTITRIVRLSARNGKNFTRVHVASSKKKIDVDVFGADDQILLSDAKPGDKLRASGTGFHRGPIRKGTTSITARKLHFQKDVDGRKLRQRPEQLSLFAI